MALDKQLVPLPIDKGLETKLDPKQEEIGYLRQASNIVYETVKLLKKRNGYDAITSDILSGSSLQSPTVLSKYKQELVCLASEKLYAYSTSRMKWTEKGTVYPVSANSLDVYKGAEDQSQLSATYVSGFYVYAWKNSSNEIRFSVQDSADNSFLVSNELLGSGKMPKVAKIDSYIYILYVDGANLKYQKFSVLSPQSVAVAVTLASNVDTVDTLVDVENCADRVYVAYNSTTVGAKLSLFSIAQDDTVSSILNLTSQTASKALDITCDENHRIIISYSNGTTIKYIIYNYALTAPILAATTIETISNVVNCSTLELDTDGTYKIYYEVDADSNYIKSANLNLAGTVSSVAVFKRGLGLAAKVFRRNLNMVPVVFDSAVQGTYFIVDENGNVVTKFQNQSASGLVSYGTLIRPEAVSDDLYFIANEVKNRIEADSSLTATTSAVARTLINFDPETKYQNAELADALHVCAGVLKMYDGNVVVEHGFHVFPENLKQVNPIPITITETVKGKVAVKEVQKISYSAAPTSGTFTIDIDGQTTAAINWNDSNATIKAAIEALSNIVTVTVTGSFAAGHTITFDDPIENIELMTNPANSLLDGVTAVTITNTVITEGVAEVKEVQTITFDSVPTSGTFELNISSEVTAAINYTQGAPEVKAAIEGLPSITTVTVAGDFTTGFTVTFDSPVVAALATVEQNSLSLSSTVGELSNGNYGYVALYRWTDNTGKDHRSAPSLTPLDVLLNGDTDEQAITIRIPTLRLTEKENVVIELYRTEDSGTTYYKVTDDLSPVLNDTTVDYVDIEDTIKDLDLIKREILYTTGGVLENIPAPAPILVTVFNGRLAVVEEDSNRAWFSKIVNTEGPVEFTDLIFRDTDPVGGSIKSIQAMDEKFIMFAADATFFIAGDGPNNLGQQDTYSNPEIISTDIGCLRPDSTVLTPNGTMFQSRKGIWNLNRSLNLEYKGAAVEAYNSSVITSAEVVGELNQIRFTTSESIALVYNYNLDRWAVFENHGALSAVTIENDYYYIREDGVIYKENRDSFSDNSSTIKMKIETGWLSFASLQGFQRVYHAMILGSFKSAHKLRIRVAYDFIDAWVQEEIIDTAQFVSDATYGADSPYGSGSPYGGDGNLYQIRLDLARQKCQSIKFLIEDAQEDIGEGFSLSSVTLRVGAKSGSNKLAASNKFGTST
jgi:hypothetical protein